MKRVIIDTDPGIDDTAAIFFALTCGTLQVELFTTVFGNVEVEQTTRNTLTLLETAGRTDIPIYQGAARPLQRQPLYAKHVHGQNGLGDVEIDPPKATVADGRAVDRIVAHVMANPGEITLLALGPLTNVALALGVEPRLAGALGELIVMGGAVRTRGNVTPVATANLYNDPEAAAIVYRSGAPIVQVGLDVCRPTVITHRHLDMILEADNPMADLLMRMTSCIMRFYAGAEQETRGARYNDLPSVAYAADPSLFQSQKLPVVVETTGTFTSGQTVVDWIGQLGIEPNVEICLEVDAVRLADTFAETLAGARVGAGHQ